MICVLCGGPVEKKKVEEEVRSQDKHILIIVEAEVCSDCGERYFPEGTIDNLIKIKESANRGELPLKEVGKVYRAIA